VVRAKIISLPAIKIIHQWRGTTVKNSLRFIQFVFMLTCIGSGAIAYADVKIKTRQTMSGQTYDGTTYIKGKRQRTESSMNPVVSVTQCDLRRNLDIAPQTKTYKIDIWGQDEGMVQTTPATASKTASPTPTPTPQRGGLITTTVTTKDTGERKKMFGYTARHIIQTMETASTPDACTPVKNKMEIDGWYIDAEFASDCQMDRYNNWRSPSEKPNCRDRHETTQICGGRTGYPVYTKTTMFGDNGEETHTFTSEVIELSQATLDAALFDVPSDYREVKNSTELYSQTMASSSASGMSGSGRTQSAAGTDVDANENPNSGLSANVKNMSKATSSVSTTVGEKKPGVVRLGLATVKTGSVGDGMNASQLASGVGNSLAEYLKAPNIELVQLEARLASQIDLEAKQKECDFVIYTNVAHKKGGGGFGKFMGGGGGALIGNVASLGGYGGYGGAVAGQVAANAVYTAASMSASVKSKDELTLDIKLQAPGNTAPALAKQLKAKAKSDGEDIITPLIEQAAQAIMDTAAKR
jgi:hypothetical protein